METWTRTTETCPACGRSCAVDWSGQTTTHRGLRRVCLAATALVCACRCQLDPDQLYCAFPDRVDLPAAVESPGGLL